MSKKVSTIKKVKDNTEATELMLDWFERENKPVSAQSLTDALGSRVSKPMVQKNLDELLAQGKLQCKNLKKVRFFFLNITPDATATAGLSEETLPADEITEDEADETSDAKEKEMLVDQLFAATSAIQRKEGALDGLRKRPTSADRTEQICQVTEEVHRLKEEIAAIANTNTDTTASRPKDDTSAQSIDDLVLTYRKVRGLWRERKEFTHRLIDTVIGDQFGLEELSEMLGIVTDEESGVSFEETSVMLPPSLAKLQTF